MRVLILTTEYLPHIGGSELAIANLTKRLPNVSFRIVSSGFGGKWLLPVTGFLRGIRRDYDIIHAWQASYAGGAAWLLKLAFPRTPLIITLQEGKQLERQGFFVRWFRKVILRKADVITGISNYLVAYARSINPRATIYLLPNGVDVEKFSSSDDERSSDDRTIITVSRLVPKNGVDILIRAMPLLPEYRLIIAGTGSQHDELQNLVRDLKIRDRVSFLGNVSQDALPGILGRSSVFIRPSRSEGLGNAFLEAMAASVPVIGTPVGGIPDFLINRETGLFCEVDNPESIARAVRELEQNNDLRANIITSAQRMVEECYDWNILAKKYYEIISRYSRL